MSDLPAPALGYGDPAGAWPLRAAVANWLARTRGIQVPPAAVLVVAGVAQALSLLAQVLVQDGIDAVAFLDPGSLGARQQLQNWQLGTVPVAVDASGLRVDELRATGAAVVVLTPAHQFPMGVVLEGERRRQLLAWATEGGLVVEDDYDAEHRYDRPPLPALRANGGDRVIYMGSVSKLLAPALRIGWVIAPARYHDAFVAAKRNADLGNAVLSQLVLAELVQSGRLERHLRLVRARHRQRRDAMLQALAAHLPTATVHGRAAGLHLTVTFEGRVFRPRTGGTGHMPGHKSAASLLAPSAPRASRARPRLRHQHARPNCRRYCGIGPDRTASLGPLATAGALPPQRQARTFMVLIWPLGRSSGRGSDPSGRFGSVMALSIDPFQS